MEVYSYIFVFYLDSFMGIVLHRGRVWESPGTQIWILIPKRQWFKETMSWVMGKNRSPIFKDLQKYSHWISLKIYLFSNHSARPYVRYRYGCEGDGQVLSFAKHSQSSHFSMSQLKHKQVNQEDSFRFLVASNRTLGYRVTRRCFM